MAAAEEFLDIKNIKAEDSMLIANNDGGFRVLFNIMVFHLLQWNARSLIANGQEFKKFVADSVVKPDIVYVQENWLRPHLGFIWVSLSGLMEEDTKEEVVQHL